MATPHISAPDGSFAPTVLLPGDPLRAKFIAENFLDNAVLVNDVRNCLGYTGTYKGHKISVMASGIGMASLGIYAYELYHFYDVQNIVRVGSAGSYTSRLNVRDVVLAESAYSESNIAYLHNGETSQLLYPDKDLNSTILSKAQELGIDCKLGKVRSSDVFYTGPASETWQQLRDRTHTECVEMESFGLFHFAQTLGKRATTLLTISDSFVTQVELDAEERQKSFTNMMKLALESAIVF